MNPETLANPYEPHFDVLSLPAQLAVGRYFEAMKQRYPDLAARAVVGPGNEGTVYVFHSHSTTNRISRSMRP